MGSRTDRKRRLNQSITWIREQVILRKNKKNPDSYDRLTLDGSHINEHKDRTLAGKKRIRARRRQKNA